MRRKHWPTAEVVLLFQRQDGVCGKFPHGCGEALIRPDEGDTGLDPVEIDHIVPLDLGGEDDPVNLQLLHKTCHERKTGAETGDRARNA